VPEYRHKLMKHRRDRSDFTKPSPPAARTSRSFLERSFSFPSTTSDTRGGNDDHNLVFNPVRERKGSFPCHDDRAVPQLMSSSHHSDARSIEDHPLDLSKEDSPRRPFERSWSVEEQRTGALTMTLAEFPEGFSLSDSPFSLSQGDTPLSLSQEDTALSLSQRSVSSGSVVGSTVVGTQRTYTPKLTVDLSS